MMPLPIASGSMSERTVPAELLAADALGHGLAQVGEGGELEHPLGDLGLLAAEQPAGQRVGLHRARRA